MIKDAFAYGIYDAYKTIIKQDLYVMFLYRQHACILDYD